jgi:hypothetical protein
LTSSGIVSSHEQISTRLAESDMAVTIWLSVAGSSRATGRNFGKVYTIQAEKDDAGDCG